LPLYWSQTHALQPVRLDRYKLAAIRSLLCRQLSDSAHPLLLDRLPAGDHWRPHRHNHSVSLRIRRVDRLPCGQDCRLAKFAIAVLLVSSSDTDKVSSSRTEVQMLWDMNKKRFFKLVASQMAQNRREHAGICLIILKMTK
jgi:hypothetical protein